MVITFSHTFTFEDKHSFFSVGTIHGTSNNGACAFTRVRNPSGQRRIYFNVYSGSTKLWRGVLKKFSPHLHIFLSLIHISEPTRLGMISYAVFCLNKKHT